MKKIKIQKSQEFCMLPFSIEGRIPQKATHLMIAEHKHLRSYSFGYIDVITPRQTNNLSFEITPKKSKVTFYKL